MSGCPSRFPLANGTVAACSLDEWGHVNPRSNPHRLHTHPSGRLAWSDDTPTVYDAVPCETCNGEGQVLIDGDDHDCRDHADGCFSVCPDCEDAEAAFGAAPTVDGWVWCDVLGLLRPRDEAHLFDCPGPHRTLLLGGEA